jgi:deazaflavin-dependent oxidoreductase (nitroreductase family)
MQFPWPSMQAHVERYRETAGADGHCLGEHLRFLLLETVGARSGEQRTGALLYRAWRGGFLVVASRGGAPQHPGWYHNLRRQPGVRLQVGGWQCEAIASELSGEDYRYAWQLMAAIFPEFDTYASKVSRHIPVVWLRPVLRGGLPCDTGTLRPGARLDSLTVRIAARHIVQGAAATRDWAPLHHDQRWVQANTALDGIILNTPSQTGWIHRYLTDRLGPLARVSRVRQRMHKPVQQGAEIILAAVVRQRREDTLGITWLELEVSIRLADDHAVLLTEASAVVAVPGDCSPWEVEDWREPQGLLLGRS